MPARDINVRRETSRRWYRRSVERDEELKNRKVTEKISSGAIFVEISDEIRNESFNGWVSPRRVRDICRKYAHRFKAMKEDDIISEVGGYGLWHCDEVGVYMGSVPFVGEECFGYFKRNVPKTQKKALKAEILILKTTAMFMAKGHRVKVFSGERWRDR